MNKLIEFFDPIAKAWRKCYFIGYTSKGHTVVEAFTDETYSGVTVLPDGHAQLRDIGAE